VHPVPRRGARRAIMSFEFGAFFGKAFNSLLFYYTITCIQ
jgi:hypothetical protein